MRTKQRIGIVLAFCLAVSTSALHAGVQRGAADAGPDVHRTGEPGIVLPRLVSEVKPQYTVAALRAKIAGTVLLECVVETDGSVGPVRVARSLDATMGLDEEAIKAVKQWRFTAATKNNVPVRMLITVQMAFSFRDQAPAPMGLPDDFQPSSGSAPADPSSDASPWNEKVVDNAHLRMRVAYPDGWTEQAESGSRRGELIRKTHDPSVWVFDVGLPQPAPAPLSLPLSPAALQRFAEGLTQRFTASGKAELRGVGQAHIGGRSWVWVDTWFASPSAFGSPASGLTEALDAAFGGFHVWTFVSTESDQMIQVACSVMSRRDTPVDDVAAETRLAGGAFAEMLKRLSIAPLP